MGPISNPIVEYNSGGTLISAKNSSPTCPKEFLETKPVFGSASVKVAEALIWGWKVFPLEESIPEGTSRLRIGEE